MEKGGVPDKDNKLEMKQKVKSASFGKEWWREKGVPDCKIASGQFNMRWWTFVETKGVLSVESVEVGSWSVGMGLEDGRENQEEWLSTAHSRRLSLDGNLIGCRI